MYSFPRIHRSLIVFLIYLSFPANSTMVGCLVRVFRPWTRPSPQAAGPDLRRCPGARPRLTTPLHRAPAAQVGLPPATRPALDSRHRY
jgi:hypothetical protein